MFSGKGILLAGIAIIAMVYFALFAFSSRGYGYPGYYGYHRPGSFFYWGGPRYHYPSQSVRDGSLGGPGRTGGIGGGK
jgi:hypothetical protein